MEPIWYLSVSHVCQHGQLCYQNTFGPLTTVQLRLHMASETQLFQLRRSEMMEVDAWKQHHLQLHMGVGCE